MLMLSLTGYVAMLAVTVYGKDQVVEVGGKLSNHAHNKCAFFKWVFWAPRLGHTYFFEGSNSFTTAGLRPLLSGLSFTLMPECSIALRNPNI